MRIIRRRILEKKLKGRDWILIYGRRKTGKSFFVEKFLDYDKYFFVNSDGTILDKEDFKILNYREFEKLFLEIYNEKNIVIDEFHRLPERFLDLLHALSTKRRKRLILITSTLWLAENKLLSRGSPILGIFYPLRFDLIDEREILLELSKEIKGRELIEASVYLREPILIRDYEPPIREFLSRFLDDFRYVIEEITWEIFREEEKRLTDVYRGVMRAISDGKLTVSEITGFLYSRGIIEKENPGVVQKYLKILSEIGIIKRLEIFGKRGSHWMHISPLLDLHFYLDEKYGYLETQISRDFIRKVIGEKISKHIEHFFRNLFAKLFGMKPVIISKPDLEIDIALMEFQKLKIVGEVKWVKELDKSEIKKIEEKLLKFKNCKRILIVPDRDILEKEPENVEVWDVKKVLEVTSRSLER